MWLRTTFERSCSKRSAVYHNILTFHHHLPSRSASLYPSVLALISCLPSLGRCLPSQVASRQSMTTALRTCCAELTHIVFQAWAQRHQHNQTSIPVAYLLCRRSSSNFGKLKQCRTCSSFPSTTLVEHATKHVTIPFVIITAWQWHCCRSQGPRLRPFAPALAVLTSGLWQTRQSRIPCLFKQFASKYIQGPPQSYSAHMSLAPDFRTIVVEDDGSEHLQVFCRHASISIRMS